MPEPIRKKNIWAALIAVVLIFGLPLGSYLYLRRGINYRKTALEELKVQGKVHWENYAAKHALGERDSLQEKIVTIVFAEDSKSLKEKSLFVEKLHAQFGKRQEIKYLIVTPDSLEGGRHIYEHSLLDDLFTSNYTSVEYLPNEIILVDGNENIRGRYNMEDIEEIRKMIRHTAVLLPMEKRKNLKLIRKKDK